MEMMFQRANFFSCGNEPNPDIGDADLLAAWTPKDVKARSDIIQYGDQQI